METTNLSVITLKWNTLDHLRRFVDSTNASCEVSRTLKVPERSPPSFSLPTPRAAPRWGSLPLLAIAS